MAEQLRAAAMTYALVDEKIFSHESGLPSVLPDAERYLTTQSGRVQKAGGSLPNTLRALAQYGNYLARGYSRVGRDPRGALYVAETGNVIGLPQIVENNHTGFCILGVGNDGETVDKKVFFGAAKEVTIPRHERSNSYDLVLSNVNTLCHNPKMLEQTSQLLGQLEPTKGAFVFRLSGADSRLASGETARGVLQSLPDTPDIVFGNVEEAANILSRPIRSRADRKHALRHILPNSRLSILTSKPEILVRYEDKAFCVPNQIVQAVDVTGAGDLLMAVTLAELFKTNAEIQSYDDVKTAVILGAMAAADMVKTVDSRMSEQTLARMRRSMMRVSRSMVLGYLEELEL